MTRGSLARAEVRSGGLTREEYDDNAKRWLAYERAHLERPVLGALGHAA